MGLKRVGERVVDILVNGTQEASFTQTQERADYDVTVNETTGTLEFIAASGTVGSDAGDFYSSQSFAAIDADEMKLTANDKFGEGGIMVEYRYNGNLTSVSCNPVGTTGWVSVDDNLSYIQIDGVPSGVFVDFKIELRKTVTDGYNVAGVTQS